MKTFVNAILTAEKFTTKKEKIEALSNLSPIAKQLMVEALSPYKVFGVKKFDYPECFAKQDSDPQYFMDLLYSLNNRDLTGNAARESVTKVLSMYTKKTADILIRVINKDLKAGFSETTLNKIYPNLVPTFNVMLAEKIDEAFEWQFPILAEAKYDGERTIAICENGNVTYLSRSGKEAIHCYGLFDEDLRKIEKFLNTPIVIDGERFAGNFTATMNAKKEGMSLAKDAMRLYAFDIHTLDDWKKQKSVLTQIDRRNELWNVLNETKCEKIILSKGKIIHSYKDVKCFYEDALIDGFEGLIIKDPDAQYEWDRSSSWNKWKPTYPVDGIITGFYEGRKGSRHQERLGGIYVRGKDENNNEFECKCGSGFSDEMRDYIWQNRDSLLGKMVELEYQEMSKAQNREIFALRFPVFIRFRDDKD